MSIIPHYNDSRDRKVKVYVNDVAVSASLAESEYSRFLNFKENFSVTETVLGSNDKVYNVVGLGYAIPQEGGVAQGTVNRPLNFNDNHFDIAETTGSPGSYDITSTGWAKVNSLAVAPLNIANATNNEAVTVASGSNITNLTFNNDEVAVYSNGTIVNAAPGALNFSTDFTATHDSGNDRFNIGLGGGYLPYPLASKKYGMFYGAQSQLSGSSFGDGLWNSAYSGTNGSANGIINSTHGAGRRYVTGGADDDLIECQIDTPITRLDFNPHIYLKISGNTIDDSRFFFGWHTGTIPTGSNTYLNDKSGFALTYQYDTAETEDTAWQINRNDGDATENKVSLGVNLVDTSVFTVELVGDAANNRWGWNLNGGSFTYYTQGTAGETPATGMDLGFTFRIEQIGGGASTIDFYYGYWTQDK